MASNDRSGTQTQRIGAPTIPVRFITRETLARLPYYVADCAGPDRAENAQTRPITIGTLRAGLGLAAGALNPKTFVVYPEPELRISIVPAISLDAIGIGVSRRW